MIVGCIALASFAAMVTTFAIMVSLRAVRLYDRNAWLEGDLDEIRLCLEDVIETRGDLTAVETARAAARLIRELQQARGGTNGPSVI